MTARTQDQVLARLDGLKDDFFGFRAEVLASVLPNDALKDRAFTFAEGRVPRGTDEEVEAAARDYLTFAIEKIENHRGISASRSVEKLGEFAWLLGRDDVLGAMDAAEYENYGAPKVREFARGMGWTWPEDDVELTRMADGLPCRDGCEEGCGT